VVSLEDAEQHLLHLVKQAAADVLNSGRARLAVDPAGHVPGAPMTIKLRPENPNACPLALGAEAPAVAYVSFGPHKTTLELFYPDDQQPHFDQDISEIVEAVIAGRYSEWVRVDGDHLAGKGKVGLTSGDMNIFHNLLFGRGLSRRGFSLLRYEPY
jgi:hypothetical protein